VFWKTLRKEVGFKKDHLGMEIERTLSNISGCSTVSSSHRCWVSCVCGCASCQNCRCSSICDKSVSDAPSLEAKITYFRQRHFAHLEQPWQRGQLRCCCSCSSFLLSFPSLEQHQELKSKVSESQIPGFGSNTGNSGSVSCNESSSLLVRQSDSSYISVSEMFDIEIKISMYQHQHCCSFPFLAQRCSCPSRRCSVCPSRFRHFLSRFRRFLCHFRLLVAESPRTSREAPRLSC
jgi:hypothetical protein